MAADGPRLLAFDTSAAQCAAALLGTGDAPVTRIEPMARGQAERLVPMLEEMLADGGLGWSSLTALAVCTGPGNFTGLRLSVAAARGLSFSLNVPAIGVTLFEALAHGVPGPVLALARNPRGGVFSQILRDGAATGAPRAGLPEPADLEEGMACLGYDAEAVARTLGHGRFDPAAEADPVAVARVALERLAGPHRAPVPLYLRPADAAPSSEPRPVILDDL